MKRFIILSCILLAAMAACPLWAQRGLPINGVFHGKFKDAPGSTEIVVTGDKAASMGLKVYRSLTLNAKCDDATRVRRIVTQQGAQAVSREVEYRKGSLYYGYYVLPAYQSGRNSDRINRYMFFLDQSLNNHGKSAPQMIVIYMESTADSDYIKRLIKQ